MARSSGSKKFHELVYPILQESGALSTTEIYDILNNREINYGVKNGKVVNSKGIKWRTRTSFTIHQISQTLRISHFFKKIGVRREKNASGGTSPIMIYECVPVEEVIDKIITYKHPQKDYDKTLPNFAKAAWVEAKQKKEEAEANED